MINHKYKFIFTRVAKTASSSLLKIMSRRKQWECRLINTEGHWKGDPNHYPLYVTKEIIDSDIYENYFKFGFVRNPWDRIISAYEYCTGGCVDDPQIYIERTSIKDFISYISVTKSENKYLSQYDHVEGCDFIGRFENLQEDFDTVCGKLGIPQQQLPHKYKSNHKHYTEYYDDETRQIVAEKYAKDIKYFGYKFGET